MKISSCAIASGIIILILGVIFHLQGLSMVGPEKSFMYSNPEWITYGIQIVITGIIMIGAGISTRIFKRK